MAVNKLFSDKVDKRSSRHLDLIVGNKLSGLWLIIKKTVSFGGSSSVFRSAFAALTLRSSAQSIIATRLPPSLTEREKCVGADHQP